MATGCAVLALVMWVSNCRVGRLLTRGSSDGPLEVSPAQLRDSALAGSTERRQFTVFITSSGAWRATKEVPWITLSPTSGGARSLLTISLHPERLGPGYHESVVKVTSEEAPDPAEVAVTFLIQQPVLKVSPREFNYSTRSDHVFLDTIWIENKGTGPLIWSAAVVRDDDDDDDDDDDGPEWLALGRAEGEGMGSIPLRVDSDDVRVGTYRRFVIITAPGAEGSPAEVEVILRRRRR